MRTYCSEQQFEQEFVAVVDMYREYFRLLESETFSMRLSTHHRRGLGKKYVDNERLWLHRGNGPAADNKCRRTV
jgi:threonyl-tRNA synthetase